MGVAVVSGFWTEDRKKLLRLYWADGWSATEIGARIGCGKNAVIGKAHRMRLPQRPSPLKECPQLTSEAIESVGQDLVRWNAKKGIAAHSRRLGCARSTLYRKLREIAA